MSDLMRERSIDQAVAARASARSNGEASTGNPPRTFEELLKSAGGTTVACRCGAPATVVMQMTVRPLRAIGAGKGTGKHPGGVRAIAGHNVKSCEPCAVQLFAAFREGRDASVDANRARPLGLPECRWPKCKQRTGRGNGYCHDHDPQVRQARAAARRRAA